MPTDPGAGPTAEGELSTLQSQLEELAGRVAAIADRFADTPDSAVAANLFAAEQALHHARLRLQQAGELIGGA